METWLTVTGIISGTVAFVTLLVLTVRWVIEWNNDRLECNIFLLRGHKLEFGEIFLTVLLSWLIAILFCVLGGGVVAGIQYLTR